MNKDETKRRSVASDLRFGYILKLYSIIQVNSVNITGFNRTREQVEHKWWDIKSSSKKAVALYKKESVKTGGGRNTAPPPVSNSNGTAITCSFDYWDAECNGNCRSVGIGNH